MWLISGNTRVTMAFMDSQDQWARIIYPEFTATATTGVLYLNSFGPGTAFFDDIYLAQLPE